MLRYMIALFKFQGKLTTHSSLLKFFQIAYNEKALVRNDRPLLRVVQNIINVSQRCFIFVKNQLNTLRQVPGQVNGQLNYSIKRIYSCKRVRQGLPIDGLFLTNRFFVSSKYSFVNPQKMTVEIHVSTSNIAGIKTFLEILTSNFII